MTSFLHWTTTKHWIPPFFVTPLKFQKKFSPTLTQGLVSHELTPYLSVFKLILTTKTKESIKSQRTGSLYFWWIANNSVLNKGESAIPHLFNNPEMLHFASDKAKLFHKNFLRTLILMAWVSLYLFSLLELAWNCIIFL